MSGLIASGSRLLDQPRPAVSERVFVPGLLDPLDHVPHAAVVQLVALVEPPVAVAHPRAAVREVHEVAQASRLPVTSSLHRSSVSGPNGGSDSTTLLEYAERFGVLPAE